MTGRERGLARERGGFPRFYRGQSRRYSPSPEVRYYRGGRGPSRVPQRGGNRGDWSDVRSRKRKAQEQAVGQRDRQRREQRHRGIRARRHGQSRVRVKGVFSEGYDSGEVSDYGRQEFSADGSVTLYYERPARPRSREGLRFDGCHLLERRRSIPSHHKKADQQPFLLQRNAQNVSGKETTVKVNHNVVSFYFTNIPHDITYVSLRQGFEVCGMLEDVYLARKRNANGGAFGFVRYGKVKDVDKLLKALNNVWFGDWKVVAKVANFAKSGTNRVAVRERGEGGLSKEGDKITEGDKREVGSGTVVEGGKRLGGGSKVLEGVVGKVGGAGLAVFQEKTVGVVEGMKEFIPSYKSSEQDVAWASRGVLVSVLNGEAIPVLQRRIFDAGFENLDIIPMGADKVLLRTDDDSDVNIMLSEASEFFNNFFSKPVKWKKDVVVRERGAWVRIYGVPLQAWNVEFFKLCVYDCGRLLKVDESTLGRIRFDYARVLISTSSLDLIISDAKVMVDGVVFDFKIVEEGGFSLGEDACLSDDGVPQDVDDLEEDGEHVELNANGDVDNLLHHLTEEWQQEHLDSQLKKVMPTKEQPTGKLASAIGITGDPVLSGRVSGQHKVAPTNVSNTQKSGHVSLNDVELGDDSIKAPNAPTKSRSRTRSHGALRKKGRGSLRHCAQNLKRIARLSDEDRKQVLRALHKTHRRRKLSSGASKDKVPSFEISSGNDSQQSVNNDWTNWLVLHGNDKVLSDDVREVGKVVGLNFKGDKNNSFDVLSGVSRKNKEGDGFGK